MTNNNFGNIFEPVIDVIINILYLAGIAIIEVWLRPFFGRNGIPVVANTVLWIGDGILVLSLLRRLVKEADEFWLTVKGTTLYQNLNEAINKRKNKNVRKPHDKNDEADHEK